MSPEPDADHTQGTGRPPEYVITTWVSAQLRDRIQGIGMSLAEALHTGDTDTTSPDGSLHADREAGE